MTPSATSEDPGTSGSIYRGTGQIPHPRPQVEPDPVADLRAAALAAARAGCYVFPVRPGSKEPALHGERGCRRSGVCADGHLGWEQRATRNEAEIRGWWGRMAPAYNIGIACGPSGLVVIDLDEAHGDPTPMEWAGARAGRDVLAMLARRAGEAYPDATMTVQTPTGGTHLYYRAGPESAFRNTAGTLGWRVDTRARGGFVVGPGSVRPEGRYEVVTPGPVAELPDWLGRALTPPARPPAPQPAQKVALPEGRVEQYLNKILERETDDVRRATRGHRRQALLDASRKLGNLVGGGELSPSVAHARLLEAAGTHIGVEQFTETEAEKTIADGMAYGQQLPRTLSAGREAHEPASAQRRAATEDDDPCRDRVEERRASLDREHRITVASRALQTDLAAYQQRQTDDNALPTRAPNLGHPQERGPGQYERGRPGLDRGAQR